MLKEKQRRHVGLSYFPNKKKKQANKKKKQ